MTEDRSLLPAIEQSQAPRPPSKGINVPTFIVSLVLVAGLAGGAGWFVGNSGGDAKAYQLFRDSPISFIQAACTGGQSCNFPGGGAFGGGGFGAGGAGATGSTGAVGGTGTQANRGTGARGFGGGTQGKVTAINGDTLTVETTDKSLTVKLSSSTTVSAVEQKQTSDLKVGDRIAVQGQTSGDTVTANRIILGSLTGLFPGGGGGAASPATPVAP